MPERVLSTKFTRPEVIIEEKNPELQADRKREQKKPTLGGAGLWDATWLIANNSAAVAHQSQEAQKKVDEIKIKGQGPHYGAFFYS